MFIEAEITRTIKSIPWFLELSKDSIQRLSAIAEVRTFKTGDLIFSEGEQHHYFYIVIEGKVCLESYVPGFGAMPVFTAESLDVIGWSSLTPVVRQKPGTARVLEPTKCLTFDANTLMGLCEADCDLGFVIMRRLANIVASRLLNHRLHLLEIISCRHKIIQ
jgi:CRP/FNR family transcriptional regulator, cyclic AMP receptor protein